MHTGAQVAITSPTERRRFAQSVKARRSRITNGKDLLPGIDGRSAAARRYRDIVGAILVDQGGADLCSESRLQLIRRFAAAAVLAEQLEGRLANGEQIDVAEHATLSSTLVRLATRIGIERVPRDVGLSLGDLMRLDIEERRAEEEIAAEPMFSRTRASCCTSSTGAASRNSKSGAISMPGTAC
jgi:hypothetical protein